MSRKRKRSKQKKIEQRPEVVFLESLRELLLELQMKYARLYAVSKDTGHGLLDAISTELYVRLTHIMNGYSGPMNPFNLTSAYRRQYQHKGDWPLIQSKIKSVCAEMKLPPIEITEEEMLKIYKIVVPSNNKLSQADFNGAIGRILAPVTKKIEEHIENLDVVNCTPEEMQVREAIKKNMNAVNMIYHASITRTLASIIRGEDYMKVRIFGEPYMPPAEHYSKLIRAKVKPYSMKRSKKLYNCLMLLIKADSFEKFMALEGTKLLTSTLVCRPFHKNRYHLNPLIILKINGYFKLTGPNKGLPVPDFVNQSEEEEDEEDEYESEEEPVP